MSNTVSVGHSCRDVSSRPRTERPRDRELLVPTPISLAPLPGPRYFRHVTRDTLVGTTFNGYTIREAVGEGGTAAVYRAEHPDHGTVAVKVLRQKLRQDKIAVNRFIREAKYGTRVQHPNVVKTIEIGETE